MKLNDHLDFHKLPFDKEKDPRAGGEDRRGLHRTG